MIQRVVGRVLAFYREGVDAGAFVRQSSRHVFLSLLGAITLPLRERRLRRGGARRPRPLHAQRRRLAARGGARRLLLRAMLRARPAPAS